MLMQIFCIFKMCTKVISVQSGLLRLALRYQQASLIIPVKIEVDGFRVSLRGRRKKGRGRGKGEREKGGESPLPLPNPPPFFPSSLSPTLFSACCTG